MVRGVHHTKQAFYKQFRVRLADLNRPYVLRCLPRARIMSAAVSMPPGQYIQVALSLCHARIVEITAEVSMARQELSRVTRLPVLLLT